MKKCIEINAAVLCKIKARIFIATISSVELYEDMFRKHKKYKITISVFDKTMIDSRIILELKTKRYLFETLAWETINFV